MIQSPICAGVWEPSLAAESLLGRAYASRTHAAELVGGGPLGGRSRGPLVDPGDEARAWGKLSKRQPGEPWGMAECWARGGLEEELGAANGLRGGG